MPLILQLCVDGNGETEIASLFIARSESRLSVGSMIDAFQFFNPDWHKTKVILGDKDFADRDIYTEKYPNAVLQICLYHTLVAFNREITTKKRQINQQQRQSALTILERLAYSTSTESYDNNYQSLLDLNLEKVTTYYNDNWHHIRDEWTQFGRNRFANYMNYTNNRSESINQKFKLISNRHANLNTFFNNIVSTVTILASERNIRAVKFTMRVSRRRFADECLERYNDYVTPFIFKKIEEQFGLADKIVFRTCSEENAVTEKANESGHTVTADRCTCMYFVSMQIPCRHIFKFLLFKNLEVFRPDLIAQRWTKSYYYDSHPGIKGPIVAHPRPMHIAAVRIPEEKDKYKKAAALTKDINNFVSNMSNSQFEFFIGKIQNLRGELISEFDPANGAGQQLQNRRNIAETITSARHVGGEIFGQDEPLSRNWISGQRSNDVLSERARHDGSEIAGQGPLSRNWINSQRWNGVSSGRDDFTGNRRNISETITSERQVGDEISGQDEPLSRNWISSQRSNDVLSERARHDGSEIAGQGPLSRNRINSQRSNGVLSGRDDFTGNRRNISETITSERQVGDEISGQDEPLSRNWISSQRSNVVLSERARHDGSEIAGQGPLSRNYINSQRSNGASSGRDDFTGNRRNISETITSERQVGDEISGQDEPLSRNWISSQRSNDVLSERARHDGSEIAGQGPLSRNWINSQRSNGVLSGRDDFTGNRRNISKTITSERQVGDEISGQDETLSRNWISSQRSNDVLSERARHDGSEIAGQGPLSRNWINSQRSNGVSSGRDNYTGNRRNIAETITGERQVGDEISGQDEPLSRNWISSQRSNDVLSERARHDGSEIAGQGPLSRNWINSQRSNGVLSGRDDFTGNRRNISETITSERQVGDEISGQDEPLSRNWISSQRSNDVLSERARHDGSEIAGQGPLSRNWINSQRSNGVSSGRDDYTGNRRNIKKKQFF